LQRQRVGSVDAVTRMTKKKDYQNRSLLYHVSRLCTRTRALLGDDCWRRLYFCELLRTFLSRGQLSCVRICSCVCVFCDLVVSARAVSCLETLQSKVACFVSRGTLLSQSRLDRRVHRFVVSL